MIVAGLAFLIPNINVLLTFCGAVLGTIVNIWLPVLFYNRAFAFNDKNRNLEGDEGLKEDLVFNFPELEVFINPNSFKYLKGTKVDFTIEGVNQGVKFLNPNVKAVCGCGESFEVDI